MPLGPKVKNTPKKVRVKISRAHRHKALWVKGYWKGGSKPHRHKGHNRNNRRSLDQIQRQGTRKREKLEKHLQKQQNWQERNP